MRAALAMALLLVGCTERAPVECDLEAATEVVYDADGLPAYPGQALLISSCGGGGFCHASDIPAENRFGAPAGLDFDLTLASVDGEARDGEVDRLLHDQTSLLRHYEMALAAIEGGTMPPAGVGAEIVDSAPRFDRLTSLSPRQFEPLPAIDSEEGIAILENFAACGFRVVERTRPRSDGAALVGWIEEPIERRCVDPTWGAIHDAVIAPSCATGACHDSDEPSAGLDLSGGGDPTRVAESLLGAPAHGPLCEDSELMQIDPGFDPERSLLYRKIAGGDVCGRPMPLIGNALSEQRRCALRAWIACGACADADDPRCAECTEQARAECGVVLGADGPACATE